MSWEHQKEKKKKKEKSGQPIFVQGESNMETAQYQCMGSEYYELCTARDSNKIKLAANSLLAHCYRANLGMKEVTLRSEP